MSKSCSERSRQLVALCQNEPSPTLSERSIVSSCFTMSPLPAWWDSIFEASDVPVFNNHPSAVNVNLAKRKLFSSPVKDSHDFHGSGSESHRLVQRELETHSGAAEIKVTNIDCESGLSNKCIDKADVKSALNEVFGSTDQSVVAGESVKPTPAKKTKGDSTNKSFDGCDSPSEVQFIYPSLRQIRAVKLALNCGKEHVSRNGQLKKARSLKGPCEESCKRCCVPKLTPSERLEIHNLFWALRNHVKQWTFIHSCVTSTAPVRKSSASGAPGAKMSSRTYHFNASGAKKKVCKTMFKNTLDICDSWIDSALSHFTNGQMSCDKRGRNKNVK